MGTKVGTTKLNNSTTMSQYLGEQFVKFLVLVLQLAGHLSYACDSSVSTSSSATATAAAACRRPLSYKLERPLLFAARISP